MEVYATDPLVTWYRSVITVMNRQAERGHGAQVQRRCWAAAAASASAIPLEVEPSTVPAVSHLMSLAGSDDALLSTLVELADQLPWMPSERAGDDGTDVALVDLFACLEMDLAGAGIMLLGPGVGYPEHRHLPAEVYLVLHGSRRWRFGGSDRYVRVDQGQVLSNSSNDLHGIEPGDDVMVALWVLMDDRY